ncbi:hypothetical protein L7F22_018870 [Adiantum nelumboides]|nr:hypothetical protein [Adiantum nelumboides]
MSRVLPAMERPRVVTVLASYLERMVAMNDGYVVQEMQAAAGAGGGGRNMMMMMRGYEQLTVFHGMKAPGIGVARYVERIYNYYNNAYYAKVGGVSTAEMNRLELEFVFTLGFRLQVTTHIFESYCCHLEREYALGAGPTFYIPPLEKHKLQFSWSFAAPTNFNADGGDVSPGRASTSCDRPIARVRCRSPYISLHLAESISS